MSFIRNVTLASVMALSPAVASAVTINSDKFTPAPAVNLIDASGFQGAVNIETDAGDGLFQTSFIFEATSFLRANGSGTVLNSAQIVDLSILYDGTSISLIDNPIDGVPVDQLASIVFPTLTLMAGDQFEVLVSFDSADAGGDIDFDIETAPIPIPAGGLLLVSGLAGLGLARRRWKA